MKKVEREKRIEAIILPLIKTDDRLEKLGIRGEMSSKQNQCTVAVVPVHALRQKKKRTCK